VIRSSAKIRSARANLPNPKATIRLSDATRAILAFRTPLRQSLPSGTPWGRTGTLAARVE
jgi:hypothetical protein